MNILYIYQVFPNIFILSVGYTFLLFLRTSMLYQSIHFTIYLITKKHIPQSIYLDWRKDCFFQIWKEKNNPMELNLETKVNAEVIRLPWVWFYHSSPQFVVGLKWSFDSGVMWCAHVSSMATDHRKNTFLWTSSRRYFCSIASNLDINLDHPQVFF